MTPRPPPLEIPARAQARRRPLRLRPVEGPPRAARAPRRRGRRDHGHLAPPEAGQATSSAASATGLRELFALPDGYEVALGNGGTTAFWDAAAFGLVRERALHLNVRRVLARSSRRSRRGAPFLADPVVVEAEPGDAPEPPADPDCRRRRLGAQRDLDRRDGAGRRRPDAATRSCSIDATSGAGGLPVDAAQADVYYFAPQKCFAADGGLWLALLSPAAHRAHRGARRARTAGSPSSCRWPPRWTTRARTRPTTRRRVATLLLLADQVEWMLAQRRPGLVRRGAPTDVVGAPLRLGRGVARSRRRSSPTRPSARWSSARSTSPTRSTPPRVAATLRANGIVDVEPYRKLGRNQLRDRHVPGDRARRRRRRSPPASTTSWSSAA